MKWSEEDTLKFAELYSESECLWNLTSPKYKNKIMRQRAIENLVRDMGKEGFGLQEAKQKIKNIRSTYNQEVVKIKKSAKSGAGASDIYSPSVKWFPILEPIMKMGKGIAETTTNLTTQMAEDDTEFQDQDDDDLTELELLQSQSSAQRSPAPRPSLPHHNPKPIPKTIGQKRRIQELSHAVKDLRSISEILARPNVEPDFDETDIFGKYVSTTLKTLSTHDSICAQQEIQGVLTKYRLGSVRSPSEAANISFASSYQSPSNPDV